MHGKKYIKFRKQATLAKADKNALQLKLGRSQKICNIETGNINKQNDIRATHNAFKSTNTRQIDLVEDG